VIAEDELPASQPETSSINMLPAPKLAPNRLPDNHPADSITM
jgi:hypothetical protein